MEGCGGDEVIKIHAVGSAVIVRRRFDQLSDCGGAYGCSALSERASSLRPSWRMAAMGTPWRGLGPCYGHALLDQFLKLRDTSAQNSAKTLNGLIGREATPVW